MNSPRYWVDEADRNKEKWMINYARIGIAAKGVVYCLIGGLTAMAAFNLGGGTGESTGRSGAFAYVLNQPFGEILLGLIAIGLLGYVVWKFIQAIKDPDHNGTDAKGIARRLGFVFSGLVYGGIAFYAAKLVLGNGSSDGGNDSRQFIVSKLLQKPYGEWVVGIIAGIIVLIGIWQIIKAITGKFKNHVREEAISHNEREVYNNAGKIGYTARGVILGIIGYLFFRAAIQSSAEAVGGTNSAFHFLQSNWGPWVMGVIALGLLAYGIFMIVRAKYFTLAK